MQVIARIWIEHLDENYGQFNDEQLWSLCSIGTRQKSFEKTKKANLVKSVLSAPVPAYCVLQASALSAQTVKKKQKLKNLFFS